MNGRTFESDRRRADLEDRRESRRGGRRPGERSRRWRRLGWLFAGYAGYVAVRALSERARVLRGRPVNRQTGRFREHETERLTDLAPRDTSALLTRGWYVLTQALPILSGF